MSSAERSSQGGVPSWLVRLEGVSKTYGEDGGDVHPVLANVSFQIERNAVTAILGRTGCGKSTLLHLIAGLLTPDGGFIEYAPQIEPRKVGILLQDSILLPWRTVQDNILLGCELDGQGAHPIRVGELLKVAGLENALHLFPYQLSGGMRRKTAIVRTLLTNPKLLLLDEPFNGIDVIAKQRIATDLIEWVEEGIRAIILVTHDLTDALKIANRILVLGGGPGEIVEDVWETSLLETGSVDRDRNSSVDRLLRALARAEG